MTNTDKLDRVRDAARRARDISSDIEEREQLLAQAKKQRLEILRDELPRLFAEVGVDAVTVAAEGNNAAFEAILRPVFAANIAAAWPEEKREEAFRWLDDNGAGDLIKRRVTVELNRGDDTGLEDLKTRLDGVNYSVTETVHPQTLTAWLREQVESHGTVPPLEKIGGYVGQEVKLKQKDAR